MTAEPLLIGASVARSLVQSLRSDCGAGAALATHFEAGATSIEKGRSLAGESPASIERAARDFAGRGWLLDDNRGWRRSAAPLPKGLAEFLLGAAVMRSFNSLDASDLAVVTLPTAPSTIAAALPAAGPIHASLGDTGEEILRIAQTAISSLTIMSPFVNHEGADFVMRMFEETTAHHRTLITRLAGDTRSVVQPLLPKLISAGVKVLDYLLPCGGGGFETFHAKVVIADSDLAYVGSANMTMYARHSMELGVLVKGRTARAVSAIVRTVERISLPVILPH